MWEITTSDKQVVRFATTHFAIDYIERVMDSGLGFRIELVAP